MRIDVYAVGFAVTDLGPTTKDCCFRLCRMVGQYEFKRNADGYMEKVLTGVYAAGTKDRQQFVFHKAYLKKFLRIVEDRAPDVKIEMVEHPLVTPEKVDLELIDHRPPFAYQVDAAKMILAPLPDPTRSAYDAKVTVVTLGPGEGKTFVAIRAAVERGERVVFVLRAQYIEKWIGDLQKAIALEPEDLVVVRGSAILADVMARARDGDLHEKIVLISNSTYRNYLTEYELYGELVRNAGYCLLPLEFMQTVKAGMLGIDEFHQDFHFNLRLLIYSHVPVVFCLTGTLTPDDQFKREVVDTIVPHELRFVGPPPKPYLKVSALGYHFKEPYKLKWTNRGRTDYSQHALEKNIMGDKKKLNNYLNMITDIAKTSFVPGHRKGKRYIVFAGRKEMCTHIQKRLKEALPHMNVLRYIGEDPYSHVEEFEVLVSTLKSAGTALDMPGLEKALMTDAVNDGQQNEQVVKRIRDPAKIIGGEDYAPEFMYLVGMDIPQHRRYHERKVELFEGKMLAHTFYSTEYVV